MKERFAVTAVLALLCLSGIAQADVFNLGPGLTNLETVLVSDPGNAGDYRYGSGNRGFGPASYGSVGYAYNIGKYEVTAGQYADFLNHKAQSDPHGLYNTDMGRDDHCGCGIQRSGSDGDYTYTVAPDWANRPVNYVSFWDSCRFANWLNSGQGNGDMETGAYTLNGYNSNDGRDIQRSAGARWFLPSQDEWYKAAYYKGHGTSAGYWTYPTQSDSVPSNQVIDPDPGNNANFVQGYRSSIGSPYFRTDAGEFENSEGAYGTFDQGGNVWEWSETLFPVNYPPARGMWGSGLFEDRSWCLTPAGGGGNYPLDETADFGFRIASVPEPSSIAALAGGVASLLGVRRRARGRPARLGDLTWRRQRGGALD